MPTGVVQPPAFRGLITTLQQIEKSVADVTVRLASGKKVNRVIDDAQSFFTARSLENSASDLSRRIDGLNQNIFAVQETDIGIRAIQDNLEQAEALAILAQERINAAEKIAIISGDVDLSGILDITSLPNITAGQTFDVIAGDGKGGERRATYTIGARQTAGGFAARIGNLSDASGTQLDIEAKLDDNGFLQIRSTSGDTFRIETSVGTADAATLSDIGFGEFPSTEGNFTVLNSNELRSQRLFRTSDGSVAKSTDRLRIGAITPIIRGEDGRVFDAIRSVDFIGTDFYFIGTNGDPEQNFQFLGDNGVNGESFSFYEYVDRINNNAILSETLEASFDDLTGQIVIKAKTSDPTSIQLRLFEAGGNNLTTAFGFGGSNAIDQARGVGGTVSSDGFVFGSVPPEVTEPLEADLENLRDSITQLANDANYRGVNLLRNDSLISIFNEDGSSRLITEGTDFTANGLGLTSLSVGNIDSAIQATSAIREAINITRSYNTTLATELSILETRSHFLDDAINTFQSGSDDLILADANKEGANLLALQARQALASTSLSLASQSQSAVLRLF